MELQMSDEFVEIHVNGEPASPDAAPPAAVDPNAAPVEDNQEAPANAEPTGEGEGDAAAKPEGEEGQQGKDDENGEALRDERGRFKGGAQGRINELTRLRHDAERRASAAERELAQLRGTATPNGALPGSAAAKPTPDQYADYGEFVEALTDWKADQRIIQNADRQAKQASEDAAAHLNSEWGAKVAEATAKLPDYAEVAGKSEIPIREDVGRALMDAERGPELIYHLAKNPDVAERLNEMSPARAAMELGRIEASLGATEAPKPTPTPPPKTSSAPPPITPVSQGSTTEKDPSKMNMEEYSAYRRSQGLR